MDNEICYICGDELLNNSEENEELNNNNNLNKNNNDLNNNNNDLNNNNLDNKTTKLKCGHSFHYNCIYISYLYTKDKKCPYCRRDGGSLNMCNVKLCKAILKSGKNKGNSCNCKIKENELYCGRHKKK